jgi:phosphatidylserine/phosphatidylglycerophosphate/cardiolipin synthase-like enzyme
MVGQRFKVLAVLSVLALVNEVRALDAPYPFYFKSEVAHKTAIYDHGLSSLDKRLKMIDTATESVEVEYFIYDRDPSGRIFTQALVRAAQRGVRVRFNISYHFKNPILQAAVAANKDKLAARIMGAFEAEAHRRLG